MDRPKKSCVQVGKAENCFSDPVTKRGAGGEGAATKQKYRFSKTNLQIIWNIEKN